MRIVQPKIMKQNVPYKPLSSHAASRPTVAQTDELADKREISSENNTGGKPSRPIRIVNPKGEEVRRPGGLGGAQNSNLFLLDTPDQMHLKNSSRFVSSFNTNGDGSGFETNNSDKIALEYAGSFGLNGELAQMLQGMADNTTHLKDSMVFQLSSPGQGQAMNFTFGASKFEGELAPKVEHSSEKKPTAPQGTSSFKPSGQLTVVSSAPKNFQDSRTLNINRFLERKPPKLSPVRREEGASSEKQPTPASSKRPSSFIAGLKPEVLASRRNHPTESH